MNLPAQVNKEIALQPELSGEKLKFDRLLETFAPPVTSGTAEERFEKTI